MTTENYMEAYIDKKQENQEEPTAKAYRNFYRRIAAYFPKDRPPSQFTKADFTNILQKLNVKSMGNFTTAKCYIRDWIEWMVEQGEMTQEQVIAFSEIKYQNLELTTAYQTFYFRNFDELYTTLEQAVFCHIGDDDDGGEFDTMRCAVYLSWYGFTVDELTEVKKSDIDPTQSIIYKTKGDNRTPVKIGEKSMTIIREYAQADSYLSRKFGRAEKARVYYKPSPYLLRSCKSAQLNHNQINVMTRYINEHADEVGKRFAYVKIYQSGIYYRIYLDEQENGELRRTDYPRLARLFNMSPEHYAINSRRRDLSARKYPQYQEYKKAFYNQPN